MGNSRGALEKPLASTRDNNSPTFAIATHHRFFLCSGSSSPAAGSVVTRYLPATLLTTNVFFQLDWAHGP
ncbi:hypothetical protein RSOLAG1IB_00545 [Rhizoctonia solani AG-1 IB]|uniref:Uncharacterized protein n=1 Tax=Thanatephorus cucumeris (strain AG1-IB / isolate 7/3/14) TaxID=1108050 RepID=A0A0B7F729_THACB|nr:hypothetical protein RSOLAG1IB_00545 [Rhizoctonia solani AG-1 IB]